MTGNDSRTSAAGTAGVADIPDWVRERIVCPICHGALEDRPGTLACTACGRAYEVEGGIPVLVPGD